MAVYTTANVNPKSLYLLPEGPWAPVAEGSEDVLGWLGNQISRGMYANAAGQDHRGRGLWGLLAAIPGFTRLPMEAAPVPPAVPTVIRNTILSYLANRREKPSQSVLPLHLW